MRRDVITATPEMPLNEAALLMASHHIGGLPVVNSDHRVVGIITDSDILMVIDRPTH
jgi:CBS domain-containing protein